MPLYTYECEKCKTETDHIYSIAKCPEVIQCPICLGVCRKIISINADRKEWHSYWDENLGDKPVLVESREHRRELMGKAGLRGNQRAR